MGTGNKRVRPFGLKIQYSCAVVGNSKEGSWVSGVGEDRKTICREYEPSFPGSILYTPHGGSVAQLHCFPEAVGVLRAHCRHFAGGDLSGLD